MLCVLPQVCWSFPGVVSSPRGSRLSHPLPLALALAHVGAQGVLVMNMAGQVRNGVCLTSLMLLLVPANNFARILWAFGKILPLK